MSRPIITALAALLIGVAGGCANRDSDRVTVTGTVRVDGQLIESGAITFTPLGDAPTTGARITNGQFTVPDAVVGRTRLSVDGVRKTGRMVPGKFGDPVEEYETVVAAEYGSSASPLIVDIQRGQSALELDLPPAKPKR
jgi:hypothetical protein